MHTIRLSPFSRILFPFVLGIVLAEYTFLPEILLLYFIGVFFSGLLLFYFTKAFYGNWSMRWVFGFLFNSMMIFAGFYCMTLNKINARQQASVSINKGWTVLIIEDYPKRGETTYSTEVTSLTNSKGQSLKAIAYFNMPKVDTINHKRSKVEELEPGSIIYCKGAYSLIKGVQNPYVFNYKKYQRRRGVSHQIMVADFFNSGKVEEGIGRYFLRLRKSLYNIFSYYLSGDELAIASALVLGYKGDLRSEIKDAYAGAGAMHVLAVSGLHVGLVYLFLSQLLKFMNKRRSTTVLKFILIIISIQLYAAITGFSPSVTRAAMMFSLIAFGKILSRNGSIYNIIFVSAFVMLLYNPQFLFDVSFQLSYVAVLGIIFLFPLFFELYTPLNRIDMFFWSLICLSLAAQLSTFPLALYYFHLFPVWFLLTNVIIVPAATLILPLGFLLILAHFAQLGSYVAVPYEYIIRLTNSTIYWIENLPPGKYEGSVTFVELLLVYLFLLLTALTIKYSRKTLLYLSVISLVLLTSAFTFQSYQSNTNSAWCFFSNSSTLIEFHENGRSVILCDSSLLKTDKKMGYLLSGYLYENGIKEKSYHGIIESLNKGFVRKEGGLIFFRGELIYFAFDNSPIPIQIELNVLILQQRAYDFETIIGNSLPELVIIPKNYPYRRRNEAIEFFIEKGITYWDVRESGAYLKTKA